jgi:hypothetical protein
MSLKIITANNLRDGLVVFLAPDGGWTLKLSEARLIGDDQIAEATAYGKTQHDARIVVEPYEIEVVLEDGLPVPVRLRERIRAVGPTVAYGDAEIAERALTREQAGL